MLKDASYPCTVKTISSVEISNTEYKEPTYIIDGLLCSGMTTFNGDPKSGKSWAAIAIGYAVAVGGIVFEKYKVLISGAVLYCALEDTPQRIKSRLEIMKLKASDNLNFAFARDLKQGDDGCSMIERWCEKNPSAKLIIIDTLQKFRAPSTGRQGAYEVDYAALGIWTALGEAQDFRISQVQQAVLDAIKIHGKPATPSQIAKLMGRKASSMTRLLSGMCEKSLLKWSIGGLYSLNNTELKSKSKY